MTSQKPQVFARFAAGLVFLVSLMVLFGWTLDLSALKSLVPGWPKVSPLTMLAFFLSSFSLWCAASTETSSTKPKEKPISRLASPVFAAIVILISSFRLGDYAFGWNLDFDLLGFHEILVAGETPARMAQATALEFLLIGSALLMTGRSRSVVLFQLLVLACGLLAWLGFSRYLYGGEPLFIYSQMSVLTALCFLLLSSGTLCLRTDGGLMALILSNSPGGGLGRTLLLPAAVLTFTIGWLRLKAQELGWFGTETGVSLFALSNVMTFVGLIWVAAVVLNRSNLKQQQANNALRESEARLNEAQHNAHIGSWRYVPPGTTTWSDEMYELFKLPRNMPVTYEAIVSRIHPEDRRDKNKSAFERALASDATDLRAEYRLVWPDGQVRAVLSRGVIRRDAGGQVIEAVGTLQDVTESKAAEAALRESEARLVQVFSSCPVGVVIIRWSDRTFVDINPAFTDLTGFTAEEVIGHTSSELGIVKAEQISQIRSHLTDDSNLRNTEIVIQTKGGELRHALLGVQLVELHGEQHAISTFIDITQRKTAEAVLRESEEHFRFLNDLGESTRTLADPVQIMDVMARMLGEHLHASRCAYADVGKGGEQFAILYDYTDGCASTVGKYQLSLFGPRAVSLLHSGQTLIIRNVEAELLPDEGADMFKALGIQAIITCPLVKDGGLRAMMAVHQTTPRDWKPGEIAIVQDVVERCWATIERRTAEKNLLQREALLRIAGRAARLGGWSVELPEIRITWSDEVCAIHEMPPGTVPEIEQALNFYPIQSRETLNNAFTACIQQGTPFDLELELITARGRSIWVRSIGEAQRDTTGAITRVQGAFQEITERKRAEEEIRRLNAELEQRVVERTAQLEAANNELRHSRAELNSLFESLPGLYLVLTPDLKIVSASDAYLKATMTTREGILGRGLFEVFPDNPDELGATSVSNLRASLDRVRQNAVPDTMAIQKYDVRRPDGVFEEHYWSPINSPVFGADGNIKYIVHRVEEVTDFVLQKSKPTIEDTAEFSVRLQQMEAEVFVSSQKLQAANRQLEASNKELEAFSYSISHDLRAPLRAVDGYSQSVQEDFGPLLPAEGQRQLQVISDSAQRMGELIDDLLSFSRLSRQPLRKKTVTMETLVRATLAEMDDDTQGRQLQIRIGELPPCEGDPALLRQVWANLLSNALKYSRKRESAILEIGCVEQDDEPVYFVRDNGSGFDMRYVNKLFGVFQRLHRTEDYEGTGVGLAIVQRIVHRHGGRIWAEAAVNQGATFYFTLQEKIKS